MERRKKVYELAGSLNTGMSYAVLATADRFKKHRHAWKVWRTLRDFGCTVYPIADGLTRFEGSKFYPDLQSVAGKIDCVIPCLRQELITDIVEQAVNAQAKAIWFQETNWTPAFDQACQENGIEVVRGCVLKHKIYAKPLAFFSPCYWHGWHENKVPRKYQRL